MTVKVLNNCNELISFAVKELNSYTLNSVIFQGEEVEITETTLEYDESGFIVGDTLITIACSCDGGFDLHALKSPIDFNKYTHKSIVVPDYAKEELITILKGE